jgi:hypothetical protein
MNRKKTPQEIETAVLLKCARRCALCFGLSHDLSEKHGQVAHLDQDRSNYAEENLAFLCMPHHSVYDSKTSQHKNYTIHEIKAMRESLHEAIALREHVPGGQSAPVPAAAEPDADRFFAERRGLPTTDLVQKIWDGRHWRILIRPTRFAKAQFQTLADCKRFVRSRYVECHSNAAYPIVLPDSAFIEDPSLQAVRCETDIPNDRNEFCECWALFRSGQFVHNRALPNHKEFPNSIHYLEILRVLSQLIEFSSRMVAEGVLTPEAIISISLKNVAGLNLNVPNQFPSTFCKADKIELTQQFAPSELKDRTRDIANDFAVQFCSAFGWSAASAATLRHEQSRLQVETVPSRRHGGSITTRVVPPNASPI